MIFSRSGESIEVVKLLDKLKGVASRVIAVTNEPESTLAKRADVTIFVDSLPDEIVAVQSYTGGVAAGLLLAGAVGEAFDARVAEVSACLPLDDGVDQGVAGACGGVGFVCEGGSGDLFLGAWGFGMRRR